VVVDAHQQNTHLTFSNSESRIENITFINGGNGDGAVYVDDQCRVEIVNCAFKNNTHRVGGGLYVRPVNASVYLDTVFFENNRATLYGGGIGCDGQLYMTRCSFTGNSAGVYGGAIYLLASRPSFIYTTTIAENTSPEGGAIYYGGTVNILDCSIYNNSANIGAGFRATNGSQLYAYFTDFNDPSYYCAGSVAVLHCCVFPTWMCGQVDNSECAPVGEELTSWGTVKSLFR
jgi:predicted outer membrane repeat protein